MDNMENPIAKCLLCGGSLPADDEEARFEHICQFHKVCESKEARRLALESFMIVTVRGKSV